MFSLSVCMIFVVHFLYRERFLFSIYLTLWSSFVSSKIYQTKFICIQFNVTLHIMNILIKVCGARLLCASFHINKIILLIYWKSYDWKVTSSICVVCRKKMYVDVVSIEWNHFLFLKYFRFSRLPYPISYLNVGSENIGNVS